MSEIRIPPNIADEKGPDTGFEKLFNAINTVKPGYYNLKSSEAFAIVERANNDPFMTAIMAFRYGYIKGQRSEKARQKALRKEREAQG